MFIQALTNNRFISVDECIGGDIKLTCTSLDQLTGVIKLIRMNLQNTAIDTTKVFNAILSINLGSLCAGDGTGVIKTCGIDGDISLFT
ncbi:Uncharacterised protein [Moraxella ovis]|nr:Uncharacterised protein [Moraxella ovis]